MRTPLGYSERFRVRQFEKAALEEATEQADEEAEDDDE